MCLDTIGSNLVEFGPNLIEVMALELGSLNGVSNGVLTMNRCFDYRCSFNPNSEATHLGWWIISSLHWPHLTNSFAFIGTIKMKPSWISTHSDMSCAFWRWLECGKICQNGRWSCLCWVGTCVGVLTPIYGRHSNAKFAWTLMMFILVKVKYFLILMYKKTFCSHRIFTKTIGLIFFLFLHILG